MNFFKIFFAAFLALIVFSLIAVFVLAGWIGSLAMEKQVVIKENSVLHLKLDGEIKKVVIEALNGDTKTKIENNKIITTIDIQHFWSAYDKLKDCRSYQDSVNVIQENYLDRATNGLKEFQKVRYFSAEFFVERIKKYKN